MRFNGVGLGITVYFYFYVCFGALNSGQSPKSEVHSNEDEAEAESDFIKPFKSSSQ